MNKPSERIVVFVTPAQKRAISATADELGISISELMRRAVIAFSATSDQVKAASIVDRLSAPRQPDALAQVLRKAAKPLRTSRAGAIRPLAAGATANDGAAAEMNGTMPATQTDDARTHDETEPAMRDHAHTHEESSHAPAAALKAEQHAEQHADEPAINHAEREIAQAVMRLNAEAAAAQSGALEAAAAQTHDVEPLQPVSTAPFARSRRDAGDLRGDAHGGDAAPEGGKFA